MHNAFFQMKSGAIYCAPIWTWAPQDNYVVLADDAGTIVVLSEVEEAHEVIRESIGSVKHVDLLEKARAEGWKP